MLDLGYNLARITVKQRKLNQHSLKNHEGKSVQIIGGRPPGEVETDCRLSYHKHMEKRPNFIVRLRAWQKPEVRYWLDAFGVFMAVTLFFCLIQFLHDR
jgi:hypothetical protein